MRPEQDEETRGGGEFQVASDIDDLKPKGGKTLLWIILIVVLAVILFVVIKVATGKKTGPEPKPELTQQETVIPPGTETEPEPVPEAAEKAPVKEVKPREEEKPVTPEPPKSTLPSDRAGIIKWFKDNRIPVYGGIDLKNIPEDLEADIYRIQGLITNRKGQITNMYRQSSAVKPSSGTITVKLYILDNGRVGAAEVVPGNDSFAQKLITDIRDLVETWSFGTRNFLIYQFSFRLS
jgi:type IV secretory pathway VirB10-like protein